MSGATLASFIITMITEFGSILADLISQKATVEETRTRMLASVEKMQQTLKPGGLMDQLLAANKQKFEEQLAALEADILKKGK